MTARAACDVRQAGKVAALPENSRRIRRPLLGLDCGSDALRFITAWILCGLLLADKGVAQQFQFSRIETIAGNGQAGAATESALALEATLSNPFGVQPTPGGDLIVASFDQHVLYRLSSDDKTLRWIAGSGRKGNRGDDGADPRQIDFNQPHEIQVTPSGDIYVADTMNHRVGFISARDGKWHVVAGTGRPGFAGDGGPASNARLNQAYSIAVRGRDLWIADLGNHRIRHVDLASGQIRTVCGTGQRALPHSGAKAAGQPLAGPRSLAVDEENLWVVLREGNSVWRIEHASGKIYHVAGTGQKGMSGDGGPATSATFRGPKGIAVEPGRAVFIADTENHAIRRIDLTTGVISTPVNRSGQPGFNGDGADVENRLLRRPHGVCVLPDGRLVIGDSENHRVRVAVP